LLAELSLPRNAIAKRSDSEAQRNWALFTSGLAAGKKLTLAADEGCCADVLSSNGIEIELEKAFAIRCAIGIGPLIGRGCAGAVHRAALGWSTSGELSTNGSDGVVI